MTLSIETTMQRLSDLASAAELGRVTATFRPATDNPGRGASPARVYITTEKRRDESVGGGLVSWTGYVDVGGNADHLDALNGLLSLVCEAISDVGLLAAQVRNAFADKRAADARRADAEERLRRVLTGRNFAHGECFVRVGDDGSAWLLDPVKRDAGWGLRFPSLTDLWRDHPELRPVRWGADPRGPFLIVSPMALDGAP